MNSSCVSALEREEMDRLLDNAKSELFSEQRRFRHTLDSIQEVKQTQSKARIVFFTLFLLFIHLYLLRSFSLSVRDWRK